MFPVSKITKPALQPLLARDALPALSHNTTATLSERGSLPNSVSARQPAKHTAGSGEFSFFGLLDIVIASVASSLGGNITTKVNKRPSLYCKKQWSCAQLSSIAVFTYLSDNRSVYSFTLSTKWHPIRDDIFWELLYLRK